MKIVIKLFLGTRKLEPQKGGNSSFTVVNIIISLLKNLLSGLVVEPKRAEPGSAL